MDALNGITPVTNVDSAVAAAAATAQRANATQEPFSSVLQRHLDEPRSDIASIRSEIAAIRSGQALFAPKFDPSAPDIGRGSMSSVGSSGFAGMPGWLDAQLAGQATGDAADPYGWRATSRQIADQIIGPGYGGLFERQMDQESGFNPDVVYGLRVSSAGAEGIAQLMPQYYPNVNRTDPISGLTAGAETMRHYLNVWDGDVRKALASYNAGLGRVQSLVRAHGANWESGLPAETRSYLNAIVGPATPVFAGVNASPVAVFGGRGPGGVLTSPLEGSSTRRATGMQVDYFGGAGAKVQSPADGVIVESAGGRVVIDHGNGWRSMLDGVDAVRSVGSSVKRSEAIGMLGVGGLLRLGVTVNGASVDPIPYLLTE